VAFIGLVGAGRRDETIIIRPQTHHLSNGITMFYRLQLPDPLPPTRRRVSAALIRHVGVVTVSVGALLTASKSSEITPDFSDPD
jgi:hypothetical protein